MLFKKSAKIHNNLNQMTSILKDFFSIVFAYLKALSFRAKDEEPHQKKQIAMIMGTTAILHICKIIDYSTSRTRRTEKP